MCHLSVKDCYKERRESSSDLLNFVVFCAYLSNPFPKTHSPSFPEIFSSSRLALIHRNGGVPAGSTGAPVSVGVPVSVPARLGLGFG
ncbi:hypothetical protein GBA52_016693 [Prunus armeniaca]|nr:hypothetical protein GBA52_016693 [Prunus armeniaca]